MGQIRKRFGNIFNEQFKAFFCNFFTAKARLDFLFGVNFTHRNLVEDVLEMWNCEWLLKISTQDLCLLIRGNYVRKNSESFHQVLLPPKVKNEALSLHEMWSE